MPLHRAHTRTQAAVVLAVLIVIGVLLTVGLNKLKLEHHKNGDRSAMGMIHQSMVIFAQNNNSYLPGLTPTGNILPADDARFAAIPNNKATGASMSARYYILLNGSYLDARALLSHLEFTEQHWKSPAALPTPDQFTPAALRIGVSPRSTDFGPHKARAREWRDNANSQALLLADRNTGPTASSADVRSIWSTSWSGPDWQGNAVFGDNHTEFLKAPNGRLGTLTLNTKYGSTLNSDDFLFSELPYPGKSSTGSAMFGYTSDDY